MENEFLITNEETLTKQEKLKKLTKDERIALLQEVYDTYGVRSNEFYVHIQPFIFWTIKRYMRGMDNSTIDDLLNNAYEELIIAFEGGNTTHYNNPIYKKPLYGTPKYYKKFKNIGEFIMYVVGSSVAKYRAKNFRKQIIHEDNDVDISEKLNYITFEMDNNLDYYIQDPEDEPLFHFFKFNDAFEKHLQMIKETCPRNNVLYNFMLWREKI